MDIKQRLANRENSYGMMLSEIYVPNVVRIIASAGYHYVILDCEHGYFDLTQVANIVAVAQGINLPVIVRIGQLDRGLITKYLDIGARGILLANTAGVEDAKKLVEMCMYAPLGDRGISTFRAHTGYNNGNTQQIMEQANEKMIVICQIEAPEAASQTEDILSVSGISGVLVGPNDLSQHMGIFGEFRHPLMQETLRHIAQAAAKCGKWSGIISANQELLAFCKSLGMNCFSSGSELNMLSNGAKAEMDKMKSLEG